MRLRTSVLLSRRATASVGRVDFADLVYVVHRCTHAHSDEPPGTDMLSDANVTIGLTRMTVVDGAVRLSDRTSFAFVLSPC